MSNLTIGDLAGSYQMRRDNARLKTEMLRISQEVSTGHKADLSTAVAGDFGPVVGIDRQLETLKGYGTAANEAGIFASSVQLAMEKIQGMADRLSLQIVSAASAGVSPITEGYLVEARGGFSSTVATLNDQAAGTALFSGAATDRAALIDGDAMFAEVEAAVAGETTAAGVAATLDAWFGPGGGYETAAYRGSTNDMAAFRVAEGVEVGVGVRADDKVFRETLKGLAMAALAENGPLAGNTAERTALANRAGEVLLGNQSDFIAARARVGTAEAAIDRAKTRNAAEGTALKISRNEITAVDPYAAATQLKEVEVQLETLYAMTARLSRLSLVDFLR